MDILASKGLLGFCLGSSIQPLVLCHLHLELESKQTLQLGLEMLDGSLVNQTMDGLASSKCDMRSTLERQLCIDCYQVLPKAFDLKTTGECYNPNPHMPHR